MLRYIHISILLCLSFAAYSQQSKAYTRSLTLMGSAFEVTAVAADDTLAWHAVEAGIAEIQRIERMISSWDPKSETSEINRNAGISPVKVSPELFQLIFRSKKVSQLTGGAFDISFAAIDPVWRFDGSMKTLPDSAAVRASVAKIDWQKIELDVTNQTIFLKEKGMKIGFGAIGKGYAANRARAVMQEMGIKSGLVNAGGDLTCWGHPPQGGQWRIGIADPKARDQAIAWLWATGHAIVTSGNYERFTILDGIRYSHIINPKTGYPVQGLKSVSIMCADAELADALATAVFVMGQKDGLALINQLRGVSCLLVTDTDELIASDNLPLHFYTKSSPQDSVQHDFQIGGKP